MHLRTFAAGKACWRRASTRLIRQAESFGEIDSSQAFQPTDLNLLLGPQARDVHELAKFHKKGFGLWSWKLPLLLSQLTELKSGDTLLYLDAGSSINRTEESIGRFREYVEFSREFGSLFFQQDLREAHWTKSELREEFPRKSDWETGQLLGGIHFLTSTRDTIELLQDANEIARKSNYFALQDPESSSIQIEDFIAHRHDQSVISLSAKSSGAFHIPDETYFAPNWDEDGWAYPIWASRLCSGNPSLKHSFLGRITRQLERRLPF